MPPNKVTIDDSSDGKTTQDSEDVADENGNDVNGDPSDHVAMPGLSGFRNRFVSSHRLQLDRIADDSSGQRKHPIPDRSSMMLRNGASNGGGGDGNNPDYGMSQEGLASEHYSNQNNESKSLQCFGKLATECRTALEARTCEDWTETFLPCWRWLKEYKWRSMFHKDLLAGMSVGVMVIPQSMSYAKLAGLPVQYGLYSALVPVYAYALFGSSRQLAVGPVALLSLLLSTGLPKVLESNGHLPGDDDYQDIYNQVAMQASFLVGVTYIFMGLARLGFVTIFLSHAVISGFISGAAVIIGTSQLRFIFGYNVERSDVIYEIIHNLIKGIEEFNWKTFVMGTLSITALASLKTIGKQYPKYKWVRAIGPLAVTAVTIILTVAFSLDDKGIPVVGTIPKGLPKFTAGEWTPIDNFEKLYVVVLSIAIVGFMESVAIAKQLASKHKYEIDPSQELIGLGIANFLGGMFQAYPITGSFSRSAVNNESGAVSGIAGMVTATMVSLVLLLLTPVFEKLPLNVLAAIVISGVLGLVAYDEAIYLWRVHKFDFFVWLTACLGCLFLGVEIGLSIAVGVSLLIVIYESAYPHTIVLGRLPGTTVYRNVKQYPGTERYDGIVMVRIDAPIYFANVQNVRDKIRKYRLAAAAELAERGGDVKYILLEMAPVSHIDTSALHILDDMYDTYCSRGQQICFSNPSIKVMESFEASGFVEKVGRKHFFACMHDAVQFCLNEMDCEAVSMHESVRDSGDALDVEEADPIGDETNWR